MDAPARSTPPGDVCSPRPISSAPSIPTLIAPRISVFGGEQALETASSLAIPSQEHDILPGTAQPGTSDDDGQQKGGTVAESALDEPLPLYSSPPTYQFPEVLPTQFGQFPCPDRRENEATPRVPSNVTFPADNAPLSSSNETTPRQYRIEPKPESPASFTIQAKFGTSKEVTSSGKLFPMLSRHMLLPTAPRSIPRHGMCCTCPCHPEDVEDVEGEDDCLECGKRWYPCNYAEVSANIPRPMPICPTMQVMLPPNTIQVYGGSPGRWSSELDPNRLSPSAPHPVYYRRWLFPTATHLWHVLRFENLGSRQQSLYCMAKVIQAVDPGPGETADELWAGLERLYGYREFPEAKFRCLVNALQCKYMQYHHLFGELLNTKGRDLIDPLDPQNMVGRALDVARITTVVLGE